MPELKPLKLLVSDILYQQKDHAEEIYFIKIGKVKLHIDIALELDSYKDHDDDKQLESNENDALNEFHTPINIPFIAYLEGSYFGDSDIFVQSSAQMRDSTAIASMESHFFLISREILEELKLQFKKEIIDIEEISLRRRAKHKRLIICL